MKPIKDFITESRYPKGDKRGSYIIYDSNNPKVNDPEDIYDVPKQLAWGLPNNTTWVLNGTRRDIDGDWTDNKELKKSSEDIEYLIDYMFDRMEYPHLRVIVGGTNRYPEIHFMGKNRLYALDATISAERPQKRKMSLSY